MASADNRDGAAVGGDLLSLRDTGCEPLVAHQQLSLEDFPVFPEVIPALPG